MSLGECYQILKDPIERIAKENPKLLKRYVDLKLYLFREYKVPPKCLSKKIVQQVMYTVLSTDEDKPVYTSVDFTIPLIQGVTPDSGQFPDYTLAEIIYISIYNMDPVNAHVKMYELLEPILLSNNNVFVKKALFIPIQNEALWKKVQERLVELLRLLDEKRKSTICSALSENLHFILYSLPYKKINRSYVVVSAPFDIRLFELCPSLRERVRENVR